MAKRNKIIKLAAFALIGYGVYKAFFAEDNAGYATTYSSASGSESKPRGSSTYNVSGRGEVSEEEYLKIQQEIAKDRQKHLEELQQELENTTDASERVKIQRAINQVLEQQHHR